MKTDAVNLGSLITSVQYRDAIHIAVYPVTATEDLMPGSTIGFMPDSFSHVRMAGKDALGIVDPFLPLPVKVGQMFWMLLTPYTISSLRHEWTHPQIPQRDDIRKHESQLFLEMMAARTGRTISEFLSEVTKGTVHVGDNEGIYDGYVVQIKHHYMVFTGLPAPEDLYFSCAC